MVDELALEGIIEKYHLAKGSCLEEVLLFLENQRIEYNNELVKCFGKKSGGYKSLEVSKKSSASSISEIIDNERKRAQYDHEIVVQMTKHKLNMDDVVKDIYILGGVKDDSNLFFGDMVDQSEDTRDCTDSAALMEGSELPINTKTFKNKITIIRPVYTQQEFDKDHGGTMDKLTWKKKLRLRMVNYKSKHCSRSGIIQAVLGLFPFIMIIKNYKWKEWILADIIAGLIVGVMQIPQGMGYALLAGLDPQYGLYVSFFPTITYFFFGTSRHNSMGTIAVVSLLSGNFLSNSLSMYPLNVTMSGNTTIGPSLGQLKASRAAGLTFCVGIIHLIMGIFRLGFITRYLSDPLVSGFTVGAAMSVFTSQVTTCFGLKISKQTGNFNIPLTYYEVVKNITGTNMVTLALTLICVAILIVFKQFINPMIVKKIKVPIPMDLVIVICGTASSYFLSLNTKYQVSIIGTINKGLPAPLIPDLRYMPSSISDVFITAIVAFSISVSLAKIFAKKHKYSIDSNQECLAYGIMNVFSSFFLCYTAAASLSRSAVQESIGGKTQLTSIIASVLVLLVVVFIGPLFYSLPTCILASIIVVALKGMFMQFVELKELWLFSYWDLTIWVVTFLLTVFIDIPYGLIGGVGLSILFVMLRTQSARSHLLGQITGTDLYKNIKVYDGCKEINGIKIFRYEGSLYYASSEHFKNTLYKKVECDPRIIGLKIAKLQKKLKSIEKKIQKENESFENEINMEILKKRKNLQERLETEIAFNVHYVIIDCSTWAYIDNVGVKTLHQVIEEYGNINVTVLLANPKTDIREMFARSICYKKLDNQIIYVSVHDAVITSLFHSKMKRLEQESEV